MFAIRIEQWKGRCRCPDSAHCPLAFAKAKCRLRADCACLGSMSPTRADRLVLLIKWTSSNPHLQHALSTELLCFYRPSSSQA